jgi:flagellar biogenesis protein FliO
MLEAVVPAATPLPSALPLRHDDVLGADVLVKVLFLTALLLGAAYLVLRFYARKFESKISAEKVVLRCEAVLRLSPRLRAYLLVVDDVQILVTESPTGTSSIIVGKSATPDTGEAA